jgi:hypothetical protein
MWGVLTNDRSVATWPAGWVAWPLSILVCWFAMERVIRFDTPVDAALPMIALLLMAVAWATDWWIAAFVPLLAVAEIVSADERVRLLSLGVVVAAVFVAGLAFCERAPGILRSIVVTVAAVMILRWIPLADVSVLRETVMLAIAAAIAAVLGGGPLAIAIAVLSALFTPLIPLRTVVLPLAVLGLSLTARIFGMRRPRLQFVALLLLAAPLILFAWSGVVARALPVVWRGLPQKQARFMVNAALAPGQGIDLEVPAGARALIVSGANVPRMRRGAQLGVIEPGHRVVTIGDAADWGALRREHFYGSRNPLPADPAGSLHGYGYSTWIDGAGRIALAPSTKRVRVVAAPNLPPGASLQVEGFEVPGP